MSKKSEIVEFVKENPGYEAAEVDEALEYPAKTTSAHVVPMIREGLLRREKNERGVFVYFALNGKKKKASDLSGKTVPVPPHKEKKEIPRTEKMLRVVKICPGLTSNQVGQVLGTVVTNISSEFTKKRRKGELTRTYNSNAQSIWFPVPFSGRRIPATDEVFQLMMERGLDFDKMKINPAPEKKEGLKKSTVQAETKDMKKDNEKQTIITETIEALQNEDIKLDDEIKELEEATSRDRQMLADLNRQIEAMSKLQEKRNRLSKLQKERSSLSTAIQEASTRLFSLKDDILQQ